jgi:hypothetical protein
MAALDISIIQRNELEHHPFFKDRQGTMAYLEKAVIVQGVTDKGKSAVYFCSETAQGPVSLATTGAIIQTLAGTIKAAEERAKDENPNQTFQTVSEDGAQIFLDFSLIDTSKVERLEIKGMDTNKVFDGYHTFGELYEHRIILFIALARMASKELRLPWFPVWRSKLHSDGTMFDGFFIMGIGKKPGNQATYHLPISRFWDATDFAETLEQAPEWDGHTAEQTLERISSMFI